MPIVHIRRGGFGGTAAMLGACLLALSTGLSPAQAIELFQPPTNASLVFSPTSVSAGQFTNLCAVNLNTVSVTVAFVLKDPSNTFGGFNSPATIPPGGLSCGPFASLGMVRSRFLHRSCFNRQTSAAKPSTIQANAECWDRSRFLATWKGR